MPGAYLLEQTREGEKQLGAIGLLRRGRETSGGLGL